VRVFFPTNFVSDAISGDGGWGKVRGFNHLRRVEESPPPQKRADERVDSGVHDRLIVVRQKEILKAN
jgi:hypothetical protein